MYVTSFVFTYKICLDSNNLDTSSRQKLLARNSEVLVSQGQFFIMWTMLCCVGHLLSLASTHKMSPQLLWQEKWPHRLSQFTIVDGTLLFPGLNFRKVSLFILHVSPTPVSVLDKTNETFLSNALVFENLSILLYCRPLLWLLANTYKREYSSHTVTRDILLTFIPSLILTES